MLQLCQLVQHLLHLLPIRSLLLHERLYALRMVQQDSLCSWGAAWCSWGAATLLLLLLLLLRGPAPGRGRGGGGGGGMCTSAKAFGCGGGGMGTSAKAFGWGARAGLHSYKCPSAFAVQWPWCCS
jgi:hypothetical protein